MPNLESNPTELLNINLDVPKFNNWQLTIDGDQFAWLSFDRANSSVNTLNFAVFIELKQILELLQNQIVPKALIIQSAKNTGFIAGADIDQFKQIDNPSQLENILGLGNEVFNLLESMAFPTIAFINGFCVGGGLELALSCCYRIALDSPKVKIGLVEVSLGIVPGWGGSWRLEQLIGSTAALDMIMTGRAVGAKPALKLGLVDCVVPERNSQRAIRYYASNMSKPKQPSWLSYWDRARWIRNLVGQYLIKPKLEKKVKQEHYPAPFAVLNNWVEYGPYSQDITQVETRSFVELVQGDTSRNLIRVYDLQQKLKASGDKKNSQQIKHVHVIGSGIMGGDIAAVCCMSGFKTTVQDVDLNKIAAAFKRAKALYDKKFNNPVLTQQALDRFIPDVEGIGIGKADIIIEAVFENLEVKQETFKRILQEARPDAIIATNTSTLPLHEITVGFEGKQANRLIGLHFFNPVPKMPLVEVIKQPQTDPELIKKALGFARMLDKLPIAVNSSPGFLVNRILMPYLLESVMLLEEGIPAEVIDKVALDFGLPMGPITLADVVGLDVCLAAAQILGEVARHPVSNLLSEKVKLGHMGKKTGEGFYKYKNDQQVLTRSAAMAEKDEISAMKKQEIEQRLIYSLLNEAVSCNREHIVEDLDTIDAGMIFGIGFPPFRGGPMHYAQHIGPDNIVRVLENLANTVDRRFTPDTGWDKI